MHDDSDLRTDGSMTYFTLMHSLTYLRMRLTSARMTDELFNLLLLISINSTEVAINDPRNMCNPLFDEVLKIRFF